MSVMIENGVHKGKYGYYPCDFETYRKLKEINKHFEKEKHQVGNWNRWAAKLPKNRLLRRWLRNDKNQRIGVEILGPKPEPILSRIFSDIKTFAYGRNLAQFTRQDIPYEYSKARYPKSRPEDVLPLLITQSEIDTILARINNQ